MPGHGTQAMAGHKDVKLMRLHRVLIQHPGTLTNLAPPHHPDMLALPPFLAPAALYARLLNALLQREDWARTRLYQHAGKTVRFVGGPLKISVCIESSGFTQASDPAIVPDVTLTIPANQIAQLPALLKSNEPSDLIRILHIEGDAGLAQTVSDLARDLRWDVEHDLAARMGDVAATRILKAGSTLLHTTRQSTQRLTENAGEYLAHESGLMANRQAFAVWSDALDTMHQRLEQLENRANALAQAPNSGPVNAGTRNGPGHKHV